jgi:hypothetical protein
VDRTEPLLDELDLSTADLAVTWHAPGTRQTLAVAGEDVWFWTFGSPSEPWADVAGTFRCDASATERAELVDLARLIPDDGHPGGREPAGAGALGVHLRARSRSAWVDAGSRSADDVREATAPLLAAPRPRAVSAVRMRAARMTPPAGAPVLGLTFAGIGTEGATLRLDPGALRLIGADGAWQVAQPPRMGLVDAAGALLDGLYHAATVPARGLGAWVIPAAQAERAQRVLAAGTIHVAGPVPPAAVRFEVSAGIG